MKFIKFLFGGLIKNDVVLEGRSHKWYAAILVVLIAIAAAIAPSLITVNNARGSAILSRADNASIDRGVELFSKELKTNGASCKVNENYKMVCTDFTETKISYQGEEILRVEYVNSEDSTVLNDKLTEMKHPAHLIDADHKAKVSSFLLITPISLVISVYEIGSYNQLNDTDQAIVKEATPLGSFTGTYSNSLHVALENLYNEESPTQTYNNWVEFLDDSYQATKVITMITTTVMFFALDVIIVLITTLLLFILARSKYNTDKKLSFGQAFKVTCFAALAPGLLTLILGSLIPYFQTIGFVIFLGMRITWLGMKISRPAV